MPENGPNPKADLLCAALADATVWLDSIIRLDHELTSHGVSCHLDVVPGVGHESPDDFGKRLQSGLLFLLG